MYDTRYDEKPNKNKKRMRASQACNHCRKKKIKCDESRPKCTQCQEASIACEYTEPKKRGPRKGYVQLLEERLAQMERKLIGPDNANQDTTLSSTPNSSGSPIRLYENRDHALDLPPVEIVNHLVDLFFQYINSVFPFVHRVILKKSIQDGTISRPLLYSVLAIGARFSNDPAIRTNPPYLAGERFAEKALSLVDAEMLQPTLANIQFWGIMSCLEYGRASGSKSWIYGGLAIRFCQELELHKEETISIPILDKDGSIDTVAMALRRRIFWSCLSLDKLVSAGTHRPQCIERSDCDALPVSISDCIALRDPTYHQNVEGKSISDDSLMNIARYYMRILEAYGEVNRFMNRAKSNSASIVWPPIAEFKNLDMQLRTWKDKLPATFQFNQANLDHHRHNASRNYLNVWLSAHAVWCSSMMVLHRGSLAFSDIKPDSITEDVYRRIQSSIDTCRMSVDAAMGVFDAMKELCGYNTIPYMGYSAYVFATVLMTSTFSGTPESCKKSSRGLKILYDLIDCMRPYWPMCERLANATKELLVAHQKLYDADISSLLYGNRNSTYLPRATSMDDLPSTHSSPVNIQAPSLSMLLGDTTSFQPHNSTQDYYMNPTRTNNQALVVDNSRVDTTATGLISNWNRGSEIDFNSLEFLYDTGLFGQVVFDVNNTNPNTNLMEGPYPQPLLSSSSSPTKSSENTSPLFRNIMMTSQPQQTSSSYHSTKNVWH
ncbi:fungal-specific transcription factor domain-containing protein [Gilbertella persicaria]|uniref:fungal-specific transcription factor domain-containing protein n=1 Tax=Gilbertella persicaria TaxID=101096 RepID=UPI00221FC216|nr:fungal-specific transcription factor domain-containing protein [Gilbertella persicaria]KAI8076676.1 fungal-specific transcription factor domain-containing protein [Gilbertella persicaria]